MASAPPIQALYARAMALQKAGRRQEALGLYTQIVLQRPKTAEAHFQIGRLHIAAGQVDKAAAAWSKALKIKPEEPAIILAILDALGRDRLLEITAANPAQALVQQARSLQQAGRWATAEAVLLQAMGKAAGPASEALAELYLATCRPWEAAALFAKHWAKTAEARLLEVQALAASGAAAQAELRASEVLERAKQGRVLAALKLGTSLSREGMTQAARRLLEREIAHEPAADLCIALGQALQSDGDLAGAEAQFQRALTLQPGHGEAFRALSAARKVQPEDDLPARIDKALARRDQPAPLRWRLHFAQAKALADLGQHEAVFGHLHQANRLQRKAFAYDFETSVSLARASLVAFQKHLADATPEGPDDPVYFVTGAPRSGTTLVETILAAHDQVTAGGELALLGKALAPAEEDILAGRLAPGQLAQAGERYLKAARQRLGITGAFSDKSIATFGRIGPTLLALPGAKVLVLKRDPRDVGLSIYRLMFADGVQRFSNNLRDIGRYLRFQEALVAAWEEIRPGSVIWVEYEALTAAPEVEIPKLITAVGLPWDEKCLAPHKTERRVDTLSFAQVRRPINRDAVAGWQRYERELEPLMEGLEARFSLL